MTEVSLRTVDATRGGELSAVNRACPIGGELSFFFDRGDDFFRWPSEVFETHRYVGIFVGERLVGYFLAGFRTGWTGASFGRYFYAGDARVLPAYRGARLADRAAAALVDGFPDDARLGFALIKKDNAPAVHTAVTFARPGVSVRRWCGFTAESLLLVRRVRGPGVCAVRPAGDDDGAPLAELLARARRGRWFAPPPVDRVAPLPDGRRRYVAERRGRVVGTLALWDMHPLRRVTILGYGWRGHLMSAVYGALRRLRGAPALPRRGGAFRSLTAQEIAVEDDDPAILRDLLARAVDDHLGRFHLLHLGFVDGDPLRAATRGLLSAALESEVFAIARAGEPVPAADARPYLDAAAL